MGYQLKWNDDLAKVAQRWADQCYPTENGKSMAHDTKREPAGQYKNVGQNMAFGASSDPISNPGFAGSIQSWYDEVSDWPATNVESFSKKGVPKGKYIGHYTQVNFVDASVHLTISCANSIKEKLCGNCSGIVQE